MIIQFFSRLLVKTCNKRIIVEVLLFLFLLLPSVPIHSQENNQLDLNHYYRFPFSIGAEYTSISPFKDYAYGSPYSIFEISGNIRYPLPILPQLQIVGKGGIINFNSNNSLDLLRWDSTHYFAAMGLGYSHRLSKMVEIGGKVLGGYSQCVYPNLLGDAGPAASHNLLAEGTLDAAFNPSFSFSINASPGVKYFRSFSPMSDFDGFVFSFGISGSFRFGKDPDSPDVEIQNIKFSNFEVPDLFAAMQSFYAKNPLGYVELANTEKEKIEDLQVSFFQSGYMDSPTPSFSIDELDGGGSVRSPLLASFNQEIFSTEGITPLTGEIIVNYRVNRRVVEQRRSVSYDLYDKKTMTWDDDRKVAAFITPADSALQNYGSFIRQSCKESELPGLSSALQTGVQVFHALGEIGCLYQLDPISPFISAQENTLVPDSVNLPRDTLKKITGDCDDLTVLYCSIMETVGIETAFITIPGHIFAAFNTKSASRDYKQIHADRSMTIPVDGEIWVPVEITMIGTSTFREAWRTGMENWNRYSNTPDSRGFIKTRIAQETYRPVGLREKDLGLQYGNPANIRAAFIQDRDAIVESLTKEQIDKAAATGRKQDYNQLGITFARLGQLSMAEAAFRQALDKDPGYLSAGANLGNIFFYQENYPEALDTYHRVETSMISAGRESSPSALKVFLNISRAYYNLEEFDNAAEYFNLAAAIDQEKVADFTYVLTPTAEVNSRAAQAEKTSIFFLEDE